MAHTEFTTVLAIAIRDILVNNQQALGLASVLYGRQLQIPYSPTAVVQAGPKRRELAGGQGPGGRVDNWFRVYIDIHSMKVNDEATESLAVEQVAESVEKQLHADTTVGGIIIHGFVTDWDPGQSFFQNGEFRTVRLTFTGRTKTQLV